METRQRQKIILIAFSFFIFFNYPHSICVQGHTIPEPPCTIENLHSSTSSGPSPHLAYDLSLQSVSPSPENSPLDADPSFDSDSPSECDCSKMISDSDENSPLEEDPASKASKCNCPSTEKSPSKQNSQSNSSAPPKVVLSSSKYTPSRPTSSSTKTSHLERDDLSHSDSPSKSDSSSTKSSPSKEDSSSNSCPPSKYTSPSTKSSPSNEDPPSKPSKSTSPSTENSPSDEDPPSKPSRSTSPSTKNSPSDDYPPSKPSKSTSPSTKNSPSDEDPPSKPSKSTSPSSKNSPSDENSPSKPSKSSSPSSKNSPSKQDNPSNSDSPSKSTSRSSKTFPSKLDSASNSDPEADTLPPESIPPNTNVDPSVKKICESTDFPPLCLATVVPSLSGRTDVHSILKVSMMSTRSVAKIALAKMKKFSLLPKPPKIARVLKDCKESYSTALENMDRALNSFAASDMGTVNTMLSAVIDHISDCEDGYSEQGFIFPAPKFAGKLKNMTSNCLAVASLIHN